MMTEKTIENLPRNETRSLAAFSNVSKNFGKHKALDNVSFSICSHSITALLGPNGAGKTTILEIMSGLQTASEGKVEVMQLDPSKQQKAIAEVTGIQVQEFNLQDSVKVGEVLTFFASLFPRPTDVGVLIERFGLNEKQEAKFRSLSGGQKRRLAIAKALVGDPELIILDEPTAGLDPQGQRFLNRELVNLKRSGKGILLSTHDVDDAHRLADRVIILSSGRILANGSKEAVIAEVCGYYKLDVDVSFSDEIFDTVKDISLSKHDDRTAFLYEPTWLPVIRSNFPEIQISQPTLSDAYFEATGYSTLD